MPVPDNFSPWEHLQNVLMKVHNKEVKDEFSDITDDDDISVARGSLKVACLLKDTDTASMTLLRMMLFWFNLRKAKDLQGSIYGMPLQEVQATRAHRPQVKLYFYQRSPYAIDDEAIRKAEGEISFRLMNETSETLTQANLTTIATKIKSLFGGATPLKWNKGKHMASYTDKERGYQLQILTGTKADAKALITKVLDIQNHTPDWKYLNYKENEEPTEAFPNSVRTKVILGKSRRLPQIRPVATVTFLYATIHVHGLPNPICLYDTTGTYLNPIVE